jgi:hypothetical protein
MLPKFNLSISKEVGKVVSFKTRSRLVTIALMMLGVVLIPLGIAAFISWLVFCFGSIIIGLLLLFLFPVGLAFPLIITQFGWELIVNGFYNLDDIKEGQNNEPYFEPWEKEKRMRELRKEYNLPEPKTKNLKQSDDGYTDSERDRIEEQETIKHVNARIDEIYEQHEHSLTEAKSKKKTSTKDFDDDPPF